MTDQEIEKLREKLGDGFEVTAGYNCAVITVKDIWKGVEFAECIDDSDIGNDVTIGKVYKCKVGDDELYIIDDKGEEDGFIRYEENFKPSTEAAYVEQLKAKAKELYGEIKNGDRFDRSGSIIGFENDAFITIRNHNKGWSYSRSRDILSFGGVFLFEKGKWAKRVEEPIMVQFLSSSQGPTGDKIIAWVQFEVSKDANIHSSGEHLAKCLEQYLNK